MSIKSQTPGIASDIPFVEKQRNPNYIMHSKSLKKPKQREIDNLSAYVKDNLTKTVKPRGGEYR